MEFFFTNTSKAKNVLKKGGLSSSAISEMEKGGAKDLILNEEQIRAIINGKKNNIFETLNEACQLLKDSWLTRSTGHKEMDFSTVQSTSYVNFTKYCYQQLPKIEIPDDDTEEVSEEIIEEVSIRTTKIWRDLYKCIKDVENNKEFMKILNRELAKPTGEKKNDFAEVIKTLHNDYGLDTNRVILPETIDAKKTEVNKRIVNHVKGAINVGIRELDLVNMATAQLDPSKGLPIGSMARGGMSSLVLLGCVVAGLVVRLAGSNIIEASKKRTVIKVKEGLAKAIKEMNSLSKYVLDNTQSENGTESKEIKITPEHIELLKTFLKEQAKIWKTYAITWKRGYKERIKDNGNREKHWSLGKWVSNEKTSSIGKLKQGLATQWTKIQLPANYQSSKF